MENSRVKPKKSYGQHFLTSKTVCHRIVAFASLQPDDIVLEIGPGTGALTEILSRQVRRTLAIEVDPELCERLNQRFQHQPSVKIIRADFLSANLLELLEDYVSANTPIRVIGNLPYNIATGIIEKLLNHKNRFKDFTLMVQKEVADRIRAKPNTKQYGYLTHLVQYHTEVTFGFHVSPGSFYPPPKVYSSVVKLTTLANPKHAAKDYPLYMRLVGSAFAHRRKTIFNNLKRVPQFSDRLIDILQECGISPSRRAESLTLEEFVKLSNCFYDHRTHATALDRADDL